MTATAPDSPPSARWLDTSSLTDPTRCPACAAPLVGRRCPACGLDVSGPGGRDVWSLSREAATILQRRSQLIATMRVPVRSPAVGTSPFAPHATPTVATSSAAPRATAPPASAGPVLADPVAAGRDPLTAWSTAARSPHTPHPHHPAPTRPGWALQTILQVLGATLLAGAGLVFTVFSWGSLPLWARGAILVGITAAVFAGAHRAAKANLRSSAEVIAALGSALVVLDAWVLLATLRGDLPGATTMAGALLLGAAVLVPAGRRLALTTASVAGLVCLSLAPTVLATAVSWAPGGGLLLAASAASCVLGVRRVGLRPAGPRTADISAPPAPGTISPDHVRTAFTVLAASYLILAAGVTLATLTQHGPAQSVAPLVGIAVASGLWAVCLPAWPGRRWSAVVGIALVLAGATGTSALLGTASPVALLWLVPLGAVIGCAATLVVVRVVPRTGATATQAGWTVVLVSGLLPALATLSMLVTMTGPGGGGSAHDWRDAVPVLAGLVVMVAGTPLLRRLGGDLFTAPLTAPTPPVPRPAPAATLPVPPTSTVPRRPSVLDHPLGPSIVAATVLLLGLPLMVPDASWAVVVQLVVVTLAVLASARLSDGPAVPNPGRREQLASLVRNCLRLFCVLAVAWAALTSLALASGADTSPRSAEGLVAASFAVVGLVLWVARSWTHPGSASAVGTRAALTFGALVIASVAVGILASTVVPLTSLGWYAAPFPLVIALVAAGLRDRRSARASRAGLPTSPVTPDAEPSGGPCGRLIGSDRLAALGAAAVLLIPAAVVTAESALVLVDPGQALPVALVATSLLATTLVLAWQMFGAGAPSQRWLQAVVGALVPVVAVLTLLSLRPVAVAGNLVIAELDWQLCALGILVVLVTWAGGRPPGPARLGCELSVVALATVTTLDAMASGTPGRVTLALAICAVGALAYAIVSGRSRWGWLALGLGVAASWASLTGATLPLEAYTAPGGAAVVAVGVWQLVASLRAAGPTSRTAHAVRIVLAGLAVLTLPTILLAPGAGAHGRGVVALVCVVWLGVTAGLLAATAGPFASRLRPLAVGMNALALVGASVGLGGHGVVLAAQAVTSTQVLGQSTSPILAVALWTVAAALFTAALAVQLARLRDPLADDGTAAVSAAAGPVQLDASDASDAPDVVPGQQLAALIADPRVWAMTLCTLLVTTPVAVLLAGGWFAEASGVVAGALVTVWGVAALLGTPGGLPRVRSSHEFALRVVPALTAAYVVALLGADAASSGAGAAGDALVLLVTWAGSFLAVATVRAAQVAPASSTWSTVAWGALATIVPLTLHMIGEPTGWWITAATVTAATWLVLGVRLRWQAPVACGAFALLVQVAVLAGPPALAAMSGMLGWIVLAIVGGTLLALGLTYERQITTARKVLHHYSELR